jgi:hypothetical protein
MTIHYFCPNGEDTCTMPRSCGRAGLGVATCVRANLRRAGFEIRGGVVTKIEPPSEPEAQPAVPRIII